MTQNEILAFEFVEFIPENMEECTLYISANYATAAHKCCCGCGKEVVTPFSPTDWKLTFDGVSVSLSPSIGNWNFECKSHYWIVKNTVKWADKWSEDRIDAGRTHDRLAKNRYYASDRSIGSGTVAGGKSRRGWWSWLSRFWPR